MDLRRLFKRERRPETRLLTFGGAGVHEDLVEVSPYAERVDDVLPEGVQALRDPGGRGLLFATRRVYEDLRLDGEPVGPARVVDLAALVVPKGRAMGRRYEQLWWGTDNAALFEALDGAGLHTSLLEDVPGTVPADVVVGRAAFSFEVPAPGNFKASGHGSVREVAAERTFHGLHHWRGSALRIERRFRFQREGKGEGRLVVDDDAHLARATGAGTLPGTAKVFTYDGEDHVFLVERS